MAIQFDDIDNEDMDAYVEVYNRIIPDEEKIEL